jgi:WD40 repeat protein
LKERGSNTAAPIRLLTSSADGIIRAYQISDKTTESDVLDASALTVTIEQVLLPTSNSTYPKSKEDAKVSLGCACFSVIRNYVGEDTAAGAEIVVALRLDGLLSIWRREEQPLYPSIEKTKSVKEETLHVSKPIIELNVEDALGTTLELIRPAISGYSRHGIVACMGCLDGSVKMIATGVGIPDPRKCNDDSKCTEAGTVLDQIGSGSSIVLSIAFHPTQYLTFAVGRKNGIIDIYSSRNAENDDIYGNFHRTHTLTHHAGIPVRSLCFTPDGTLLISGCDQGHLYVHDISSFEKNQTILMVAAILSAHKSYILSISPLPDSKRFLTCSADKTVKVWDVSTPNNGPIHTFTGHEKIVWNIASSLDGRRAATVGDDGLLQVYSIAES